MRFGYSFVHLGYGTVNRTTSNGVNFADRYGTESLTIAIGILLS